MSDVVPLHVDCLCCLNELQTDGVDTPGKVTMAILLMLSTGSTIESITSDLCFSHRIALRRHIEAHYEYIP